MQNDETPLVLAAKGRNYVIQELLLGRGADVNWADQAGMTALHYESAHGDSEAVKLLLAFGADPNPVDVVSDSSLFGANPFPHNQLVLLVRFLHQQQKEKKKSIHKKG